MKELFFASSNKGKIQEVIGFLPFVTPVDIDLHEIQDLDPQVVARQKLIDAKREIEGAILVEDTAVFIDGMNGFPGPMIKWLYQSIGAGGIAKLVEGLKTASGEAVSIFGIYIPGKGDYYFKGSLKGTFVYPKGEQGFGWDAIFVPEGYDRTFAQLTFEEKTACSMRSKALVKLKEFIDSHEKN